jgi:hypothetical protein
MVQSPAGDSMSQLRHFKIRIDVDPSSDAQRIAFVCGQVQSSGQDEAVTLESTPRQLTPAELSGSLREFLVSCQHLLEGLI